MTSIGVRRLSTASGFTLLEIIVALVILSTALVTILATLNTTIYKVGAAARLTDAVTLAREEMELFRISKTGISGKESIINEDKMLKRNDFPQLQFTRRMEPTAIPGAYELKIEVFTKDEEDPVSIFELSQYVLIQQGASIGS